MSVDNQLKDKDDSHINIQDLPTIGVITPDDLSGKTLIKGPDDDKIELIGSQKNTSAVLVETETQSPRSRRSGVTPVIITDTQISNNPSVFVDKDNDDDEHIPTPLPSTQGNSEFEKLKITELESDPTVLVDKPIIQVTSDDLENHQISTEKSEFRVSSDLSNPDDVQHIESSMRSPIVPISDPDTQRQSQTERGKNNLKEHDPSQPTPPNTRLNSTRTDEDDNTSFIEDKIISDEDLTDMIPLDEEMIDYQDVDKSDKLINQQIETPLLDQQSQRV